jgi:hypothetical protein
MALEAMGSERVSVTFSVRMGARMPQLLLVTIYTTLLGCEKKVVLSVLLKDTEK